MTPHAACDGRDAGERRSPRVAMTQFAIEAVALNVIAVPEIDRLFGRKGGARHRPAHPGRERDGRRERHHSWAIIHVANFRNIGPTPPPEGALSDAAPR